jgi:C-8 sterol isomerase
MPSKSSKASSGQGRSCAAGSCSWLKIFGILLGVLAPVFYLLDQNLERFYVFNMDQLDDVSQRGIKAHGNDTRAIVQFIVDELAGQVSVSSYVNRDEDWMFNNAGGAMGAMYIIHASASPPFPPLPT